MAPSTESGTQQWCEQTTKLLGDTPGRMLTPDAAFAEFEAIAATGLTREQHVRLDRAISAAREGLSARPTNDGLVWSNAPLVDAVNTTCSTHIDVTEWYATP